MERDRVRANMDVRENKREKLYYIVFKDINMEAEHIVQSWSINMITF